MKKKKRVRILLLVLVLAAVGVFAFLRMNEENKTVYHALETPMGNIETYYSFSGNLALTRQDVQYAPTACEVRDVYAAEGDMVKKDDRLLRFADGTVLRAGIDGEVTYLPFEKNDILQAGEKAVEVSDLSTMRVEFDVDEFDISFVSKGDPAIVTLDALNTTVDMSVTRVSKTALRSGDLSSYRAYIEPETGMLPENALPGMRCDIKIPGVFAENVRRIKLEDLRFDEYNRPYAYTEKDGEMVLTYLETGVNDGIYVEITGGVSPDEKLYAVQKSIMEQMQDMRSSMMKQ